MAHRITNRPEQVLQIQVFQFLDVALTRAAVAFAVPNAARRSVIEGAMNKRAGVKAGVPDIAIVTDGRVYFIELKSKGGKLSDVQRAMQDRLRAAGAPCVTVFNLDDVRAALRAFGIETREAA